MEKLHFKIGLSGTFWKKKPSFGIYLDDQLVGGGNIQDTEILYFEFDREIGDGDHKLDIKFFNKDDSDILKDSYEDPNNFKVLGDLLLNIESIEIDDISVGQLLWSNSTFTPDDSSIQPMKECVNLGFNGCWTFPFQSPFYIWLLEKI
jgi:hypothetical protein